MDDLRTHFEPIEVFRRGRIVDDFPYDLERQPGEEIRDYDTRFNILLGWTSDFLHFDNLSADHQSTDCECCHMLC